MHLNRQQSYVVRKKCIFIFPFQLGLILITVVILTVSYAKLVTPVLELYET